MKKIIFSTYDDIKNPYYGGGGAIAIHEVARRLTKAYKVKVITGRYNGSKDQKIDGVNYKRIGVDVNFSPQLSQFIYSICLPFYVLNENYDVWIESFTPPFSTGFLQLFTKKPVVGLVHMLSGEDMKRKYKLPFDLIEKIGLKTYKYFIVNTNETKNKILKSNSNASIEVIGNGVDKIRNNSGKSNYALFIGRIEINQKGIDLLIRSWKNIDKKLIIAGNGEKLTNLPKNIETVGNVTGSKKDELFKNASLVVVPSRFETYSMTTLEAFSYGLPVVSYDIDGLKWTPNGAILKAHPFNSLSFAKACNTLFKDKSKRIQMGKIGKKYASSNTWGEISKNYNIVLSKIIYK